MNQTKSAIPPIKAPVVPASAPATPKQPQPKPSNVERLERALVGKFFSFVFDEGTRFRAGKFESVINDAYFMVRYFAMKDGTLQKWTHIMKMYAEPSVETLVGFWVHDSEQDLKDCYDGFLKSHLKRQEEKREQESNNAGKETTP
jgi:hypothetical protein